MNLKSLMSFCLILLTTTLTLAQKGRILIVSTNIDSVGSNRSGTFLREIAYPFQYFTDQGYQVDILTPKGGAASIYQRDKEADELIVIRDSELFKNKTSATLNPGEIKPKDYKAVF